MKETRDKPTGVVSSHLSSLFAAKGNFQKARSSRAKASSLLTTPALKTAARYFRTANDRGENGEYAERRSASSFATDGFVPTLACSQG